MPDYAGIVRPDELAKLARLRRARDLMDREYATPLDVASIARVAWMSPAHFQRQFRAAYGETPYGYLMTRRIERAKALLRRAGFTVREPAEPHICCGSAGTYNLVQPEIAGQLRARKLTNIMATEPDLIAAGNIGCMTQLAGGLPVVHTVQLLDWMAGGPAPLGLRVREPAPVPVAAE